MTSLKTRIVLLFAGLGCLCAVGAAMGMWGVSSANRRAQDIYEEITLSTQYLQGSYRLQLLAALALMEAVSGGDAATRAKNADFAETMRLASERQAELFRLSRKPAASLEIAGRFVRNRDSAMLGMRDAIRLARAGDTAAALTTILQRIRPPGMAEAEDIDRLIQVLGTESQRTHESGLSESRVLLLSMTTILGLGGLLLGVCGWRQVRSLNTGLGDIEATLGEVSHSLDLTCRAPEHRRDEIGRTAGAFNVLLARIEHALWSVRDAAERLRAATQEIVAGNMNLSIRTERQAASLEQTAASMAQLSTTVKQNADNARQANILANQATDLARAGDTVVQRMVGTIERIGQSSGKISDITGIIEALAFQTNILALNAAVEAARAGDQGRGFAVVAGEVRTLAQRSASAAKEIKDLIGSSVAVVFEGTQQAVEVGSAMDGVMQAIQHVADFVGRIAAASDEQSRGIEEVSRAVVQMDEVTQQNAALVEEASAVTQSLETQAVNLKEAVSAFGLTGAHL